MKKIRTAIWIALLVGPMSPIVRAQTSSSGTVPVTIDNYDRAQSDVYFGLIAKGGAFGKFRHSRDLAPIGSIKVEVKKKHHCNGRKFSCFAAHLMEQDLFWRAAPWSRLLATKVQRYGFSLPAVFIAVRNEANRFLKPAKLNMVVRCQPWFYLGLMAHSFFGLSERA